MIRSLCYTPDGVLHTDLNVEEFKQMIQNPENLLWVDFEASPPDVDAPIMQNVFDFHPLAVDDALQESHVPKLDDWGDYLYIVLHSVVFDREDDGGHVDTLEVDVFLGFNYLVTHHDKRVAAIEKLWMGCIRDQHYLKDGGDYLLYRLADEIVASFMPVVEELDVEIDKDEDQIFNYPSQNTLEHILLLKRSILHLRRIIGPQREVLNKLARDDYQVIDSKARVYFRDVYDHLVRLYDVTESLRDLVSGTLDIYLSVINNRMNDVMKTLTTITTLFMPISFIAGFFGMNFFQPVASLSRWTDYPAYSIALLVMILTPVGMYQWMRRKGWM
jgi:magnesium transporter